MEIRIPVLEFSRILSLLQGVVQRRNVMPILSNILIEATGSGSDNGSVTLVATDLDVGMRITHACEVITDGITTIPARALLDVVKVLPGPDVTLSSTSTSQIVVKSGKTNAKLLALSPSEFPALPLTELPQFLSIESQQLKNMIEKTLYAASMDENRYNLTGIYFEPAIEQAHQLTLVATDGHRLSRIQKELNKTEFQFSPVILPRKGLIELLRLMEDIPTTDNQNIQFALTNNHAIIKHGTAILTMRLIDGKFPDYQQVIPKISDKLLRASRMDLLTSVRRVSVLTSDKNQSIKFIATKGELKVSCTNPETGEVSDDVPVEYNGPTAEFGFNVRYIIDAISSLSDTNILMKFTDPLSPVLFTGTNDATHVCIVMPMRT